MDNLIIYLWAIARYNSKETPFFYSHLGKGALWIVAEINMEFLEFCANENNPAAKPAETTNRVRHQQ